MKIVKYATKDRIIELVDNLKEASSAKAQDASLELSNVRWVYPISLLPIVVYANRKKLAITCSEKSGDVCGYLDSVCFPTGTTELRNVSKNYLPITQISCNDTNHLLSNYEERILSKLDAQSRQPFLTSLKYLTSELEANVREHSGVDNYWIFSQYWSKTKTCEIALCDIGIGYKASYEGTEYEVENHADAILNAFGGKSSKSSDERGTGLPSIAKLFVEGYGGIMVVMSGNAVLHKYGNQNDAYTFDGDWQGCFVGLRFPVKELNMYLYL